MTVPAGDGGPGPHLVLHHRPAGDPIETARPAVFLDRDGVVIENRVEHVRSLADVTFIDGAARAVQRLVAAGHPVFVVTNQSVVGRGLVTREVVLDIQQAVVAGLGAVGRSVVASYLCPHEPEAGCGCRKPRPGLLLAAAADHGVDLDRSWLVGDAATDVAAARAAGARPILVTTGRGREQRSLVEGGEPIIVADLAAAAEVILGEADLPPEGARARSSSTLDRPANQREQGGA